MANELQGRNKTILVPVDFTPVTSNAIHHAVKLAENLGFKVVLLHVINRDTRAALGKENAEKAVESKLQEMVTLFKTTSSVQMEYAFREGSIFEVISDVATELKVFFMVLGTHGKKGFQHLFGSYALKVITHSPAPVIVVQKKAIGERGYKKIVFPISLYTEARQQVFYAVITHMLLGSEILVFQQKGSVSTDAYKLDVVAKQISDEFKKNDVRFTITKAEKTRNFSEQLLDFAVTNDADVIMMMTDSSIDNPNFDNSSWSEKLLFNAAQIPVLSINPVYLGKVFIRSN
jgi:nucleotide-binding universal stress UspA family protein